MAKTLSLTGIQTGDAIEAKHVSQSIKALTGAEAYDITISGSLTVQGLIDGEANTLNNLSASYALTASHALNSSGGGEGSIGTLQQVMESGSITTLVITASAGISSSGDIISPSFTGSLSGSALEAISASFAQTASYVATAQTASYVLNAVSASFAQTASFIDDSAKFPFSGSAIITGSLVISSSNQDQSLKLFGSGSNIFSIEGSRGTLFKIDDNESDGILFSANNVSGTPVLEVHEDNTIKLGKQNGFGIVISGSNPLPNDADAKILVTGSIYHSGSNAYFNAPLTASSFKATPGVINQLTASYAISASVEVTKEISSSYADTASYVETAQTASYILASNIDQPFINITASNISASSKIITNRVENLSTLTLGDPDGNVGGHSFIVSQTDPNSIQFNLQSGGKVLSTTDEFNIIDPAGNGTTKFNLQGNLTASANISASGNLFANVTDNSDSNFKTIVYDTSTGQFFRTGSYGGGGGEGFPFSGSAEITGSLLVSQSFVNFTDAPLTASIVSASSGITGSLLGIASTASYVETAQTASYVTLAQTASYVTTAQTASFVTLAQTASFITTAQTASYVETAQTASFVTLAQTASFVTTAQTASFVLNAISSSYALSASYAVSASVEIIKEVSSSYADTASYVETAQTASFVTLAQTASFVTTAQTASFVTTAQTASYVETAQTASYVTLAQTASYVTTAQTSSYILASNIDQPFTNITASGNISASGHISASSFNATLGNINELTASHAMNVQPENNFMPVTIHTTNFNSTSSYAGHYNIVGGNLSITVTTGSTPTDLTPGMEWNFFQTSSGNNFTFTAGAGVNLLSRNMHIKLAAIGSAGTLKYISDQTFHLIGDLTL